MVPLFPMIYGDCVSLNTMQGDRIGVADADKVLTHVLYAEMPIYAVGDHLYFEEQSARGVPARPRIEGFEQVSPRRFRLSYRWE